MGITNKPNRNRAGRVIIANRKKKLRKCRITADARRLGDSCCWVTVHCPSACCSCSEIENPHPLWIRAEGNRKLVLNLYNIFDESAANNKRSAVNNFWTVVIDRNFIDLPIKSRFGWFVDDKKIQRAAILFYFILSVTLSIRYCSFVFLSFLLILRCRVLCTFIIQSRFCCFLQYM